MWSSNRTFFAVLIGISVLVHVVIFLFVPFPSSAKVKFPEKYFEVDLATPLSPSEKLALKKKTRQKQPPQSKKTPKVVKKQKQRIQSKIKPKVEQTKPKTVKPKVTKPKTTKPKTVKSKATEPKTVKPKATKPKTKSPKKTKRASERELESQVKPDPKVKIFKGTSVKLKSTPKWGENLQKKSNQTLGRPKNSQRNAFDAPSEEEKEGSQKLGELLSTRKGSETKSAEGKNPVAFRPPTNLPQLEKEGEDPLTVPKVDVQSQSYSTTGSTSGGKEDSGNQLGSTSKSFGEENQETLRGSLEKNFGNDGNSSQQNGNQEQFPTRKLGGPKATKFSQTGNFAKIPSVHTSPLSEGELNLPGKREGSDKQGIPQINNPKLPLGKGNSPGFKGGKGLSVSNSSTKIPEGGLPTGDQKVGVGNPIIRDTPGQKFKIVNPVSVDDPNYDPNEYTLAPVDILPESEGVIEGELEGRKIISRPKEKLTTKENQIIKISFRFTVLPNGEVEQIFPVIKGNPELERIGIQHLRKFRFEALYGKKIVQKGIISFTLERR